MGRSDTSTFAIGIKIEIKELIEQITIENIEIIKDILIKGLIDDENGYMNEVYCTIVNEEIDFLNKIDDSSSTIYIEEIKEKLKEIFESNGDLYKSKRSSEVTKDISKTLYDSILMMPYKDIISTERWGYSREGTNGISKDIKHLDIEEIEKEIKKEYDNNIKNYKICMMIYQQSG